MGYRSSGEKKSQNPCTYYVTASAVPGLLFVCGPANATCDPPVSCDAGCRDSPDGIREAKYGYAQATNHSLPRILRPPINGAERGGERGGAKMYSSFR